MNISRDSLEGKEGELYRSVSFKSEESIESIHLETSTVIYKKIESKISDFFDKKINENINLKNNIEQLKKSIKDTIQESLLNNWDQKIKLIIKEINEIKNIIEPMNIKYNIKKQNNIINNISNSNTFVLPKINTILDDITEIKNDIIIIINKLLYNKDINDNKKEKMKPN